MLSIIAAALITTAAATSIPPEEIVFYLQYIGSDYGGAVQSGTVVAEDEYREVSLFAEEALRGYSSLRPNGPARSDLVRIGNLINARAPWDAVRALARELTSRIADELDVVPYPLETPDLESGRALYREGCAPCHGAVGGGDGWAAPGMIPQPNSFREPLMALRSPHEVFNAAKFGIAGTAMPSYQDGVLPRDLWDIAFFVMTLRDGFDPNLPVEVVPLSLKEVASQSDEELLRRLRVSRPGAQAREIDYYRSRFRRSGAHEAGVAAAPADSATEVAEVLERTFARVAEGIFPSVVGVSAYERSTKGASSRSAASSADWTVGDPEDRLYPGFVRTASGTGFLVTADGDILTSADVVRRAVAVPNDSLIDVELAGNLHCRARIIGLEPTIDLAVLGIVPPLPVRPVSIGDSDGVRIGHWAIAVGDPPGPEQSFVPGTISARPERECYQEHRTKTLIQSSAVMETGGFGGPLVTIRGDVVGLTIPGEAGAGSPGSERRPVDALPINLAMTIYRALKVKESERSPVDRDLGARARRRAARPDQVGLADGDLHRRRVQPVAGLASRRSRGRHPDQDGRPTDPGRLRLPDLALPAGDRSEHHARDRSGGQGPAQAAHDRAAAGIGRHALVRGS
jgi:S1-C subfamily serine protease/mono/diheme cytochrome c family protein